MTAAQDDRDELAEITLAIEERDALLMRAVAERDRGLLEAIEVELAEHRERLLEELRVSRVDGLALNRRRILARRIRPPGG